MQTAGQGRVRNIVAALVLLLASTIVAVGAGELAIRLVAPQQLILLRSDIWVPADSVGWDTQANLHTKVNTGDRTVTLITDSAGFRVSEGGRPNGEYRILLLGDSFMQALQVEYEQSLPGLIERCFVDSLGRRAAVWDAGVDGWDPPQYLIKARRILAHETFDALVVAVFLGNDIVSRRYVFPPREPTPRRQFRFPRKFSSTEVVDAVFAPINDALETRSHLFIFMKTRLQGLLMRLGLTAAEVPKELRRDRRDSPDWDLTGGILAEIDSLARSHGIPTLFILIPSVEQVDSATLRQRTAAFGIDPAALDLDQPDSIMTAVLKRRGIVPVSLLGPLRKAAGVDTALYGRVDPHLSPAGHWVAWTAVEPPLAVTLGAWPAGTTPGCADR